MKNREKLLLYAVLEISIIILLFFFVSSFDSEDKEYRIYDEHECGNFKTEKFDDFEFYVNRKICIPLLKDLIIDLPEYPEIYNLSGNQLEFKVMYRNSITDRPNISCAKQLYFSIIGPSIVLAKVKAEKDFFRVSAYLHDFGLYKIELYIEMEPVIIDNPFQIYVPKGKDFDYQRNICNRDRGDYPGRWLLGNDCSAPLPMNYTEEEGRADKDDYYNWEPFCCQYKKYKTYEDVMSCIGGKWIHMSGDSQTRYILIDFLNSLKVHVPDTKWQDDRFFEGENFLISQDFRGLNFESDFGLNISEKSKFKFSYPWTQRRAPDVLIVNIGLWSLMYGKTPSEYAEEMQKLSRIIENNIPLSTRVILRTTTPSRRVSWRDPNLLTAYNQALANVSWINPDRIHLLDAFSISIHRVFDSSPDWLHFRGKVSVTIANIILNMMCND